MSEMELGNLMFGNSRGEYPIGRDGCGFEEELYRLFDAYSPKRWATEVHHVIYHRRKNKPDYDNPANLCLICRTCHDIGNVNSRAFKVEWYRSQKAKGYDMDGWLDSLNRKAIS